MPTQPAPARLPLLLTMGDPAGIGPAITLTAWLARRERGLSPFLVLGDPDLYRARARQLNLQVPVTQSGDLAELNEKFDHALCVLPLPLAAPARPGKPDTRNAETVIASIKRAVDLIHAGRGGALITNPISKQVLYEAGFPYPGHTEYLGALAQAHGERAEPVMMLHCPQLRVVPATVHIPLRQVPTSLTRERIETVVRVTADALAARFGVSHPRIAVTGLNPHAGEEGALGEEEQRVIAPAIAALREAGYTITGPWPADTIFQERLRDSYDCVIAMYHDQALIPIKTLAFDHAVNITLGLPFLRTSPDHGTAFDIAGSGKASPSSLIEALRVAAQAAQGERVGA
ncbi:MAG: 4-hydroxythreonine-4-phosphate dehydrogenase PdxA [Alphaproteobacteria bacterium]|nr:MAG: 4-hydroxythreonine-4-phosphate dehydrogenase PdxA [Alphaproteobacteria bacterium]